MAVGREERGGVRSKKEHEGNPGASRAWGGSSQSPLGPLTCWPQDSAPSGSDSDLLLSQPGIPDLVQPFPSQIMKVTSKRSLSGLRTCEGCGINRAW